MTVSTTSFFTMYMKQYSTPGKSDHPLGAVGVVAQTPCDVVANLCLHTRLAEVDIAVAAQLKTHHVLQRSHEAAPYSGPEGVRRSEAIREVGEDWQDFVLEVIE